MDFYSPVQINFELSNNLIRQVGFICTLLHVLFKLLAICIINY
jgi:hypothetical protein